MDPTGSTVPDDPGGDPGSSPSRGRTVRVLGYVLAWAVVAPSRLGRAVHPLQRRDGARQPRRRRAARPSTAGCASTWAPTCRTSGRPRTDASACRRDAQDDGDHHARARPAVRRHRRTPRGRGGPGDGRGRRAGPRCRAAGGGRRAGADRAVGAGRAAPARRAVSSADAVPAVGGRGAPWSAAWSPRSWWCSRGARSRTASRRRLAAGAGGPPRRQGPRRPPGLADPGRPGHPGHPAPAAQPVRHLRPQQGLLPRGQRPRRRDRRPAARAGRRTRRWRCWSATGTTTSAWTRWCARSPTRPVPRSCWTPATTPRPARPGSSSASTPWTPPSRGTTRRSPIAGNHDNGTFVNRHLASLGWTHLDGKPVEPFADVRITGVDDPRSSGLGTWRDETDLSFAEVKRTDRRRRVRAGREGRADRHAAGARRQPRAIGAGARVHRPGAGRTRARAGRARPASSGRTARSATPTPTGRPAGRRTHWPSGASCAATPSSPSSPTADGRPVGIQPVTVRTTGKLSVADYVELDLEPE